MKPGDARGVTIIKRRKTVGGDGHHGGAWKVAYADFVTAMMAFFLLMWLLNATTEQQRKGLADYFDPRIPISRVSGGGSGMLTGDSVLSEAAKAQNGVGASDSRPTVERQARGDTGTRPEDGAEDGVAESFTDVENAFRGLSGESDVADEALRHVRTRLTDAGLVIELFAAAGRPLFELGSAAPTPRMSALLEMVGQVLAIAENRIAVGGHTDATPFASRGGYGNWELSSDRAHAARRALAATGLDPARFARVTGKGEAEPAFSEDPTDPRNRRIEITLLRSDLDPGATEE